MISLTAIRSKTDGAPNRPPFVLLVLELVAVVSTLLVSLGIMTLVVFYVIDRTRTTHAIQVMHYHINLVREVGIIAHSCGVRSPRALRRFHARVVMADGRSVPLDELFPEKTTSRPTPAPTVSAF